MRRIIDDGLVAGRPVRALDLFDVARPPTEDASAAIEIVRHVGDISDPAVAAALVSGRPDVVFHLASVVSAQAETDLELGYRVNLDGSRLLFDAISALGHGPRVVFASSGAVFGAPLPERIPDDFHLTPLTSYGTQKMMVEALLCDYTRRGFLDGVAIRLPAVCIRPGKPNKAASGFFSGLIREPLNGIFATVPVPRSLLHTSVSPRTAVDFLMHAAALDGDRIGPRRGLNMPGVCCTVGEQIDALERIVGTGILRLIRDEPDEAIARIVRSWPAGYTARRAAELGFVAEKDFDEIIRIYIDEEMPRLGAGQRIAEGGRS